MLNSGWDSGIARPGQASKIAESQRCTTMYGKSYDVSTTAQIATVRCSTAKATARDATAVNPRIATARDAAAVDHKCHGWGHHSRRKLSAITARIATARNFHVGIRHGGIRHDPDATIGIGRSYSPTAAARDATENNGPIVR